MGNASRYLQRFAFILFCILGSISAGAQQNWFLYIKSESDQPFYVRIGETIHSSSSVGHLVINGLRDSTYRLAIGFPQSQVREQVFTLPVRKKDHGFVLKKSDTRSWVLYDWLDQETIRSPRSDSLLYGERKKDDAFASLMAAVVKDSAVLYTSVVKTEPPKKAENVATKTETDSALVTRINEENKPDSILVTDTTTWAQRTTATDTIAVTQRATVDTIQKTEPEIAKTETPKVDPVLKDTAALVVKEAEKEDKTPPISKLKEQTDTSEKKLVFLDNTIGIKKDTITVIIPIEKDSAELKTDTMEKKPAIVKAEEKPTQPRTEAVADIKQPDTAATAKAEMQKTVDTLAITTPEKEPEPGKASGLVLINSDCVKFATDNDVDKLRIKMMKEKDPGNMIFVAHKSFKSMCFATKHIKALSELFPSDELRFRFFETAWPFVSDTSQFITLEETLTDSFFITRFRTLLRRQ